MNLNRNRMGFNILKGYIILTLEKAKSEKKLLFSLLTSPKLLTHPQRKKAVCSFK